MLAGNQVQTKAMAIFLPPIVAQPPQGLRSLADADRVDLPEPVRFFDQSVYVGPAVRIAERDIGKRSRCIDAPRYAVASVAQIRNQRRTQALPILAGVPDHRAHKLGLVPPKHVVSVFEHQVHL